MKVRVMRLLRIKHNIHAEELGRACGMTSQRISQIELSEEPMRASTKSKLRRAFMSVSQNRARRNNALLRDITRYSDVLFDAVEEYLYDL